MITPQKYLIFLSFLLTNCSTLNIQNKEQRDPSGLFSCFENLRYMFREGHMPSKRTDALSTAADRDYVLGNHKESTFTVVRNVNHYSVLMRNSEKPSASFRPFFESLYVKPGTHWLDAGGGEGYATKMAIELPDSKINTTLISVETNAEDIVSTTGEVRRKVLKDRFIEDIPDDEMMPSDLITDVYGPMAYSSSPDLVLRKYLSNLKDDGVLYLHLGEEQDMFGKFNQVITKEGKVLEFSQWLEKLKGTQTEILSTRLFPGDSIVVTAEKGRTAKVTLDGDSVVVPKLKRVAFKEGKSVNGFVVPRTIFLEEDFSGTSLYPNNDNIVSDIDGLLRQFSRGSGANTFIEEVDKLKDRESWANFSSFEVDFKGFEEGHLEKLSDKNKRRVSRLATEDFRAGVGHVGELSAQRNLKLITDLNGSFLTESSPDIMLKRYIDSLADNGTIILGLGRQFGGIGEGQVIDHLENTNLFRYWLEKIDGLNVKINSFQLTETVDGKQLNVNPETINIDYDGPLIDIKREVNFFNEYIVIKVKNRKKVNIPKLEYLGRRPKNEYGVEIPFYRQLEE